MNIGITGGTGYIGTALIRQMRLNKDINLSIFDRRLPSVDNAVELKDFVKNKDCIIHLAGTKGENCYEVNVLGTKQLLQSIILSSSPFPRVIFSSSFAVYEEVNNHALLDENTTRTLPRNNYGLSKLFAEELLLFYERNHGIPVTILRIANPYGPAETRSQGVIAKIIDAVCNNQQVQIDGNGSQYRDFIYINDLVDAFIQTLKNKDKSLILNICSGQELSLTMVIKKIETILKKKAIVTYNKDYQEKGYWIGDNRKAKKEINFSASTPLDQGLKKTIESYIQNNI